MKMPKLSDTKNEIEYQYGNLYYLQSGENWQRIVIGPNTRHIALLDKLTKCWSSSDYYVLYISLVSHTGNQPGRYQSPLLNQDDMRLFIWEHMELLEGYGGQHFWVGEPTGKEMIIYDHHNILYAYGNISKYLTVLTNEGYQESEFSIPCPHSHSFEPSWTHKEDELFDYFDWKYSQLHEDDDY